MQAPRRAPRSLSLGSLGQRYDPGTAAVALEDGRLIELRSVGAARQMGHRQCDEWLSRFRTGQFEALLLLIRGGRLRSIAPT